jgi:hypothetical protein
MKCFDIGQATSRPLERLRVTSPCCCRRPRIPHPGGRRRTGPDWRPRCWRRRTRGRCPGAWLALASRPSQRTLSDRLPTVAGPSCTPADRTGPVRRRCRRQRRRRIPPLRRGPVPARHRRYTGAREPRLPSVTTLRPTRFAACRPWPLVSAVDRAGEARVQLLDTGDGAELRELPHELHVVHGLGGILVFSWATMRVRKSSDPMSSTPPERRALGASRRETAH